MSDKTTDQLVDDLVARAQVYGASLVRDNQAVTTKARDSVRQARKALDARLAEMRQALAAASGG